MAPSFNRPIERIRSLKTVLYDATGVYHPHCFYLRDVTPEDGATNVQRFALLMLSSLDYELWIHGSDGKPACRLTGVHLYEASIWSGECVIYIHQKDARAASAEGGACFGGGGRSAGSLRGGGPLFGAAGAPPAAGGGAPIISTVHGANDYLSERRSSSSAEATAYKNNLGGGIPDVGAERRSSGETALHAHSWRPSSWSTASHRESGAVVDNYLRPHVHRLQRFLKRHYHKVSSSGFRAVQELFDSHCARCNTGGLDWDMILLAPDPDAYLLSLLQRNKLLLPFEQGSSNCQGGHHLPVVRRGGHVSQHVNNGGTAGGLTGDHHSTGGGRPGIHRTGSFAPPTGGDLDLLLPDHPVLEPQFSAPPHRSRGGAAHPLREYSSLLHHRARDEQAALLDDLCGLDERAIGSCIARGVLLPRPANQMLSAFKTTLPPGGGQEGAEARLTEEAVRSLNVRRLGLRGDHLPPGGSGDSSSVGGGSADLLAHRDGKAGTIDATAVAEPSHRDAAADGLSAMVESSAMGATAGFHTHTAGSNQRQPMGPFGGDAPPGARRGGGVAGADSVGSETTGGPKPSSEFSRDVLQRLAEIENELYIVKKCNLIYALSTMGGNERSRTSASSVSCAVSSAGAATSSDVEKASSKIYELLRARIVRIVLIIGDAFRKKLEKTLYAGDSGDTAGLDRRHNFRSRTPAFGTSGLNSGLLQHSGDSGPHRISAGGGLLTTTIHSSRAIDHRRTLSFHTLVQVYLVISQCIETFTQLYRGIGGHGGTIEIRALSYAEKNADLPHVSMVERLYSGILSDVLEAIEGCLNRFEHLFKSSMLCAKIEKLFPFSRFPLDFELPDDILYKKANGHALSAADSLLSRRSTRRSTNFSLSSQAIFPPRGPPSTTGRLYSTYSAVASSCSSSSPGTKEQNTLSYRRRRKLLLTQQALQCLRESRRTAGEADPRRSSRAFEERDTALVEDHQRRFSGVSPTLFAGVTGGGWGFGPPVEQRRRRREALSRHEIVPTLSKSTVVIRLYPYGQMECGLILHRDSKCTWASIYREAMQ